jgi:hydroxymethylbilane synthase
MLERRHPGLTVEVSVIRTSGDRITDRPLYEYGGKGLFTKELEQALLEGSIDFAVHSFKDVPVTMPLVDQAGLCIAAVPQREDVRDVLVCAAAQSIAHLPRGARVGTGSLRRRAQLLALRTDLVVEPIRGNIDTRLRKCRDGEYGAVILAMAGLKRAALFDSGIMHGIDTAQMLPSPGQGALALQCRVQDQATLSLLVALNDPVTETCVSLEREVVRLLEGDCHSPIAALAEPHGTGLLLRTVVARRDGSPPVIAASASGERAECDLLPQRVFNQLTQQGVRTLLGARV